MKTPLGLVIAGLFEPYDFESITISTSVVGLTESKYKPATQILSNTDRPAVRVIITSEGAFRYRYDGGEPTSSIGHVITSGDVVMLVGEFAIKNFKAVRSGVSDAVIRATYER